MTKPNSRLLVSCLLVLPLLLGLGIEVLVDLALQQNLLSTRELTLLLLDPLAHGALVLGALLPWKVQLRLPWWVLIAGVAAGVFIDLDHFLKAGSFSLVAATHLPGGRPFSHSLGFACFLGLAIGGLSRRVALGSFIAAGVSLHVLRDLAGNAPWYWPLPVDWPQSAPYELRVLLFLVVAAVGAWLPQIMSVTQLRALSRQGESS